MTEDASKFYEYPRRGDGPDPDDYDQALAEYDERMAEEEPEGEPEDFTERRYREYDEQAQLAMDNERYEREMGEGRG